MGSDLLLDEDKFLLDNKWVTLWKLNGAEKRTWLQAIKTTRNVFRYPQLELLREGMHRACNRLPVDRIEPRCGVELSHIP